MHRLLPGLLLAAALSACPSPEPPPPPPEPAEDWSGELRHMDLQVDLASRTATATLELATDSSAASFEAQGLTIESANVPFRLDDGRLDFGFEASPDGVVELEVTYGFDVSERFEGYWEIGEVLTWPWHCGNVFPCRPDPSLGFTVTLDVPGALHPASLDRPAPAYQVAWVDDPGAEHPLGTTAAGTDISWWGPEDSGGAEGTTDLVAVFDWLESTLGPYPWGGHAGPVAVDWSGAIGGIELHPYWHVGSMHRADVHAHEAVHGWFGTGIRLECWEDLVLSEGTATYLTARVTGQVVGPEAEAAIWEEYDDQLTGLIQFNDAVALPEQRCGPDTDQGFLFSRVTYVKGAMFYRSVAQAIGADSLDAALSSFFTARNGTAASMQDLLDHLQDETGFDPEPLAEGWLRQLGRPE